MSKKDKLSKLSAYRSSVNLNAVLGGALSNYKHLRSVSKAFEDREDYKHCISPITKSASNIDADIMIVLNDWCNIDCVDESEIPELKELGYSAKSVATNNKLDTLLSDHLNLSRKKTYITNAFPYLKPGIKNTRINKLIMDWSIKEFLIPQIEIIKPKFVLCLGYSGYLVKRMLFNFKGNTVQKGISDNNNIREYAKTNSLIFCQNHPSAIIKTSIKNENWTNMVKIMNNNGFKL